MAEVADSSEEDDEEDDDILVVGRNGGSMTFVAGVAGCDWSIGEGGLELSSGMIGLDSYESNAYESLHCDAGVL